MVIILCVIALILVISIYDYFSARNWQQVTSSTRNEIVFESRNKEYGAYVIRRDYNKKMLIIFFSLCAAIGSAYGALKFIHNLPKEKEKAQKVSSKQVKVKIAPVEIVIPPPPPPPPPPMEKLVAFVPPVVVDEEVDTPPVNQEDLEKGKISDKNQEGTTDHQDIKDPEPPKEIPPPTDEIAAVVEEDPEFPGGMSAFSQFLAKNINYPQVAIEEGIQGKCLVQFVVTKNGDVADVQVVKKVTGCPECDAEAKRVIQLMPKWKPGKNGGKPVSSRYVVPVNYRLE